MDKQAQDKRWNELSEDSKKFIRYIYNKITKEAVKPENQKLDDEEADGNILELWGRQTQLIELFGYDNLNPKPPVREWKDVPLRMEKCDVKKGDDYFEIALLRSEFSEKLFNKIIATARISKIIDLGYGGMVSEEEWNDCNIPKYSLLPREWMGKDFDVVEVYYKQQMNFISFHTQQQAEEFMSHESNRKLVEMYHCL